MEQQLKHLKLMSYGYLLTCHSGSLVSRNPGLPDHGFPINRPRD
jgi:hypothetical protein